MLNLNSPIVQAMLQNTPPGEMGNMNIGGGYFGSPPTIERTMVPVNQAPQYQQPMYPNAPQYVGTSQQFQQNPYASLGGGYQPIGGYPYTSPYMAAGGNPTNVNSIYGQYQNPYFTPGIPRVTGISPEYMAIPEVSAAYQQSLINGISYDEQVMVDSGINKILSRAANKALGRSSEEIEERAKIYDPIKIGAETSPKQDPNSNLCMKGITITRGDKILADSGNRDILINDRFHGTGAVWQINANCMAYHNNIVVPHAYYVASRMEAAKRAIPDDVGIIEYLNDYAGPWAAKVDAQFNRNRYINGAGQLYNREQFKKIIDMYGRPKIMVNGVAQDSPDTPTYFDSYRGNVGGYSGYPQVGGHPVIPNDFGGDPEILTNLRINEMGQIEPVMPPFMRNNIQRQMEESKNRFRAVCEGNNARQQAALNKGAGLNG